MNGSLAGKLSFWASFAGVSVFILSVAAGASKSAGHPVWMFVVVGISDFIFAAGLVTGIAGLRRMKVEGLRGILGRALSGVVLNGLLLVFMAWLTCFLVRDAEQTAAEQEREARQLMARVGGGEALEKALLESANENFAFDFQALQKGCDSAWASVTNPPILDMGLVKTQADLRFLPGMSLGWTWDFRLPIKIGDTVHVKFFVESMRTVSKPGWGIVVLRSELINQKDEVVQLGEHRLMIPRRPGSF